MVHVGTIQNGSLEPPCFREFSFFTLENRLKNRSYLSKLYQRVPLLNRKPNPKCLKLYNQNPARFKKGFKGLTAKEQRAVDRKNNWKAKHEELIRNIRAARGESDPEPSYDHRGGSGRGGQGSYGNGGGGGYGGSYGNDYGAQSSYSSKPSNGYGSNKYNSYNNNNYGYDDRIG